MMKIMVEISLQLSKLSFILYFKCNVFSTDLCSTIIFRVLLGLSYTKLHLTDVLIWLVSPYLHEQDVTLFFL